MKEVRQAKILELIKEQKFNTQEDLQRRLNELGFRVTQATVSRDLRELGVIKAEGDDGVYKYRRDESAKKSDADNTFAAILNRAALTVAAANNLVVVKTYTGMGSAVGAAVDAMEFNGVIGTLAGDDTLLIIAADNACASVIEQTLNDLIR